MLADLEFFISCVLSTQDWLSCSWKDYLRKPWKAVVKLSSWLKLLS